VAGRRPAEHVPVRTDGRLGSVASSVIRARSGLGRRAAPSNPGTFCSAAAASGLEREGRPRTANSCPTSIRQDEGEGGGGGEEEEEEKACSSKVENGVLFFRGYILNPDVNQAPIIKTYYDKTYLLCSAIQSSSIGVGPGLGSCRYGTHRSCMVGGGDDQL
jgi:hypothetical protein